MLLKPRDDFTERRKVAAAVKEPEVMAKPSEKVTAATAVLEYAFCRPTRRKTIHLDRCREVERRRS
jgi:hypothetical protein